MNNNEILDTLNCIILEQENIKKYIKELEERVKGIEKYDDEY